MKAIFGNGTALKYINAIETEEYWGGSSRRTLTFTCAADAISVDELNEILSNANNLQTLALESEDLGITNYHEGYVLKLNVGLSKELVQPEGPDSAAAYVDRLVFKLGRPTFIEQQLAKLGISV